MNTSELLAIYQVERSDEQNSATLIVAVNSAIIAYIGVATAFLGATSNLKSIPDWILLGAAAPPLILSCYVRYQQTASMVRQSYLMYLERKLNPYTVSHGPRFPGYVTLHRGLSVGGGVKNLTFVTLGYIDYIAWPLILGFFSFYVVFNLSHRIRACPGWVWFYFSVYLLMIVVNFCVASVMKFSKRRLPMLRRLADQTAAEQPGRWR
ncbi:MULTISPECIES: hypothetical protein [Streptomyces violaceusniger group]|uniref:hypothetical protein n=1 Tax=Streptomyces violaceusniger group TaxID=2839105 RepID=UPI001BA44C6D|nr:MULTISPECIES: hypothetical protein [Streptomyces violaceusniger group]